MSRVALIGASGNVGSRLLDELISRDHEVTAIARHPEKIAKRAGVRAVAGDLAEPQRLAGLLEGHDAVISSTRFADTDFDQLLAAVRQSGVRRYLVVGGAGSLYVAPGELLIDQPDFPDAYKTEAAAGQVFLEKLRRVDDLDWTFLSPSAMFGPGERTGSFRLGRDDLLSNAQGSSISYEDFAVAMVDELEQPAHIRQRFTVGY